MSKGYWIARIDVADMDRYQAYIATNGPPVAAFGGRYLVRGGTSHNPEGTMRSRNVVVEFPSYQAALDCYNSPGYQAAMAHRVPVSTADFLIIEGYAGPQPGA